MTSYTCPYCGRTSHLKGDAMQQYCGACHVFFRDALARLAGCCRHSVEAVLVAAQTGRVPPRAEGATVTCVCGQAHVWRDRYWMPLSVTSRAVLQFEVPLLPP